MRRIERFGMIAARDVFMFLLENSPRQVAGEYPHGTLKADWQPEIQRVIAITITSLGAYQLAE